ncbi:hypothetical protein Daqu01_02574 [Deinococcus aquaticus]
MHLREAPTSRSHKNTGARTAAEAGHTGPPDPPESHPRGGFPHSTPRGRFASQASTPGSTSPPGSVHRQARRASQIQRFMTPVIRQGRVLHRQINARPPSRRHPRVVPGLQHGQRRVAEHLRDPRSVRRCQGQDVLLAHAPVEMRFQQRVCPRRQRHARHVPHQVEAQRSRHGTLQPRQAGQQQRLVLVLRHERHAQRLCQSRAQCGFSRGGQTRHDQQQGRQRRRHERQITAPGAHRQADLSSTTDGESRSMTPQPQLKAAHLFGWAACVWWPQTRGRPLVFLDQFTQECLLLVRSPCRPCQRRRRVRWRPSRACR